MDIWQGHETSGCSLSSPTWNTTTSRIGMLWERVKHPGVLEMPCNPAPFHPPLSSCILLSSLYPSPSFIPLCCVPQPHHVHVAPLAMHRWYQGWAHPTVVTAGTAGSALPALPAPPACSGGRDPHVQQDPANWSNADSWGLRLWGHLPTGPQASRRPTDLWGPLFIEKLDTAKK